MSKAILKIWLCFFCFFLFCITQNISSQQYLVKIGAKSVFDNFTNYICSESPVSTVYLIEKDKINPKICHVIKHWDANYGEWNYEYVVLDKNKQYCFYLWDPIIQKWKTSDNVTPNPSVIWYDDYHSYEGGMCWHENWVYFSAETFDPLAFSNITLSSCKSEPCNGSNLCVLDFNADISFDLSHIRSETIQQVSIILKDKNGQTIASQGPYSFQNPLTLNLSNFNVEENLDQDLYFQTETYYNIASDKPILGDKVFRRFNRSIPEIEVGDIEVIRSPCDVDIVRVTLDPTIIANIDKYHFRARDAAIDEDTSPIIVLTPPKINTGNPVELKATIGGFGEVASEYLFQIYGKEYEQLADNDIIRQTGCAFEQYIYVEEQPTPLSLSSTVTLTTYGGSYHVSATGASDGEALLTLIGGDSNNVAGFSYSNDGQSFSSVPSGQISWQTSTQVKITGLSANYQYWFKVDDITGCLSNAVNSILLQEPSPFLVYPTGVHVSCHVNNTGNNSDGQFYIWMMGGIAPYSATLAFYYGGTWVDIDYHTGITVDDWFNNIWPGNFRITVVDGGGSTKTVYLPMITNPELTFDYSVEDVNCYGGSDGSITLNCTSYNGLYYDVDGMNSGHTYDDSYTFSDLPAGSYYATVTNENACSAEEFITIAEPTEITIDVPTVEHIAEYGDSTGKITAQIFGDNNYYTYTLENATTGDLKNGEIYNGTFYREDLKAGEYYLYLNDVNSCVVSTYGPMVVLQPDTSLYLIADTTRVDCYGNATGEIQITGYGGWNNYYYYCDGVGNSTGLFTGLKAGIHTVSVVDDMNVTYQTAVFITQPDTLLALPNTIIDLNCYNDNSGMVVFDITGGTYPYYTSDDGSNWQKGSSIVSLGAGDLTLFVKDTNNCTVEIPVTLTQPDELFLNIGTIENLLCYQDSTGRVEVGATGGTAPYSFSTDGSNWEIVDTITNLGANASQEIWVSDNHGCLKSTTVTITEPELLEATTTVHHLKCYMDGSGAITFKFTGGASPYYVSTDNIIWTETDSIGSLQSEFNKLLFIKDEHNCLAYDIVSITQPPELVASIDTIIDVKCFGESTGEIGFNITGGTPAYRFSHNQTTVWTTGNYINMLPSSDYLFTILDDNDCEVQLNSEVTQPLAPLQITNTMVSNLKCFGDNTGKIFLTVTGGTSPFSISNDGAFWFPGDSLTNQPAYTNQTIYIRDDKECQETQLVTIIQPDDILISIDSITTAYCEQNNGQAKINISGGTVASDYTYNWTYLDSMQVMTGNTIISDIYSGVYKVIITDDNFCMDSMNISVPDEDGPSLIAWTTDSTSCYNSFDGNIQIEEITGGTPGYTIYFEGMPADSNVLNLSGGEYHIRIVDAKNCKDDKFITVPKPDSITIHPLITEPTCFGDDDGAIDINIEGGNGGFLVNWFNGSNGLNVNSLQAGYYFVNITDRKGCAGENNIYLNNPQPITISGEFTLPSCTYTSDGRIKAIPAGGSGSYKYIWSTSDTTQTIINLDPASYGVTVTDSKLCEADTLLTLETPDSIMLTATLNQPNCYGMSNGNISLAIVGGTPDYSYTWSTGDTSATTRNIRTGNYSVSVRDSKNCLLEKEFFLPEPIELYVFTEAVNPLCNQSADGRINTHVVGGNGGYIYSWSNGTSGEHADNLFDGKYSVTVTDEKGCSEYKHTQIIAPPLLEHWKVFKRPTCYNTNDGAIDIAVTGGTPPYHYRWNTNDTTSGLENLLGGTYDIEIHDANNCVIIDTITLGTPKKPNPGWVNKNALLCTGNKLVLDGGNYESYRWFTKDRELSLERTYTISETGVYYLELTDINGCIALDSMKVKVSGDPLDATLLITDSADIGEIITAIDVTWPVPDSIHWIFDHSVTLENSNEWSQDFLAKETGLMNVTLRAWYQGCYSDSSKTVYIFSDDNYKINNDSLIMPLILDFIIYPNPNTGYFMAKANLSREADINLLLVSANSLNPIDSREYSGAKEYEVEYNIEYVSSGVYILLLKVENEQRGLKIIIH